ncbi:MAG TPA: hypothetical protein VN083_02925 [Vicinamibacteria bacterium]|nr:hypothetical protein [Vicinamibacteria bacterium]
MRRDITRGAWLLFLVLIPGVASSQNLGDAAAREKARRKDEEARAKEKPKVYTNEDLRSGKPKGTKEGSSGASEPSAPQPLEPESTRRRPNAGSEAEQIWREKGKAAHDTLKQAEERLASLDSQASRLLGQRIQSTDTNEILRLAAEQQGVLDEMERTKQEIAAAKKDWESLQEQARREGVPAQWLEPRP